MSAESEVDVMTWLRSDDPSVRGHATEILGDWVRRRSGNDAESARRFHQALLDAALVETDHGNLEGQLNALHQSEWPVVDVDGWDKLARLAPTLRGEPAAAALEHIKLTGQSELADVLEAGLNNDFGFPRDLALEAIAFLRAN